MARKKYRRTIKIKEFNNTQVVIPILKENGTVDRGKTFEAIDKQFEQSKIPFLGGIKKSTLQDIGKEIQRKKAKEKVKKEVKKDDKDSLDS